MTLTVYCLTAVCMCVCACAMYVNVCAYICTYLTAGVCVCVCESSSTRLDKVGSVCSR